MTEHIHPGLGLTALILAALSLKLMFRYYKLMGRNMANKASLLTGPTKSEPSKTTNWPEN